MESAKNPAQPSSPDPGPPKAVPPGAGQREAPWVPGHLVPSRPVGPSRSTAAMPARPVQWRGAPAANIDARPAASSAKNAPPGDDTQQDLPLPVLLIGLGLLMLLALEFWEFMPLPRFFVREGEDRSLVVPGDPRVYDIYVKAKAGDADAMTTLGTLYMQGQIVLRDDASAVKWFKEAAKQDHTGALYNLGLLYMAGHGVKCDESYAFELFERSASHGFGPSMIQLGLCYANGRGVMTDRSKAADWLRRAATSSDDSIRDMAMDLLRRMSS
jgi:hypothetical protein